MNRDERLLGKPEAALAGFFGSYTSGHAHALLWDMFSHALCATDEELGAFSRKELLAGYEALGILIDAAHGLYCANNQA